MVSEFIGENKNMTMAKGAINQEIYWFMWEGELDFRQKSEEWHLNLV